MAYLYRYFDVSNRLLYIGISINAFRRLAEQIGYLSWFDQIRTVTLQRFKTMRKATKAEQKAIEREHPKFNVSHNRQKKKIRTSEDVADYRRFLKQSVERRRAIIRAASFFGTRQTAKSFKISRQRVNQIINGK